jgi:predicted enzyme related to lactoylglutathione lyase
LYSISHEEIKRNGNGGRDMPTIVHFEIPSDDTERSKKFYNELFGWKIENWTGSEDTPEGMEYWMVTTVDDKGNDTDRCRNSKELQTFLT